MDDPTKINHLDQNKSRRCSSSSSITNTPKGQFPNKRNYFPKNERVDCVSIFTALILASDEIVECVHGIQTGATLLRQDVEFNAHLLHTRIQRYL